MALAYEHDLQGYWPEVSRDDWCGEHADPLYLQVEERHYTTPNGSQRVTFSGCRQLYGHMECLVGARR
jgi:hypothetical protein